MTSAHGARLGAIFGAQQLSNALGAVLPGLSAAKDESLRYIGEGRDKAVGAIGDAQPLTLASIGAGYDRARAGYETAKAGYTPYVDGGARGWAGYLDASGANGPEGNARATANFQVSPSYRWDTDQQLDGIARHAASTGAAASGNTLAALEDRAHHLADQEYGTYTGRLRDIGQTGLTATGQVATLDKGIGDLGAAQGRDTAAVYDTNGARLANIYTGTGTAQAGVATNAANSMANSFLGTTGKIADLGAGALKAGDAVKTDQANMWLNAGKALAGMVGSAAGGGGVGGGLSSLRGLFGGGSGDADLSQTIWA